MLSPIYGKKQDSEEEKEFKSRNRQERQIMKSIKERRLDSKKAGLEMHQTSLRDALHMVDAANRCGDEKIRKLQTRIREKEEREKQERERAEEERVAKMWKEWQERQNRERQERQRAEKERNDKIMKERQERERREAEERQRKEAIQQEQRDKVARRKRKEAQKLQEEQAKERCRHLEAATRIWLSQQAQCSHADWWAKLEGRKACPKYDEVWTYLLQCPGCKMEACPKCQHDYRPSRRSRRR